MEVRFVNHLDCPSELIKNICILKKQHWNYPIIEHIKWFNNNLSDEDLHVCIFNEEKLIAYTTLVNVKYKLENDFEVSSLGLGSVCVDKSHLNQKYGLLVVQIVSAFIKFKNCNGILLCKDDLVTFYQKNNWIKYNGEINFLDTNLSCNLLSTEKISSQFIKLNKIF